MNPILFALTLLLAQSTASLEGFVIKLGTSTPLVRARVTLRSDGFSAGAQTVTTDASGKFAFKNLPPGRYRVMANRDGYIPAEYGQRSRGAQGTPITLTTNQAIKDVVLALTPTGSISGRIYDRYGDPIVNATVQVLKYVYQDGRRILIPINTARTNDLGEYRLF